MAALRLELRHLLVDLLAGDAQAQWCLQESELALAWAFIRECHPIVELRPYLARWADPIEPACLGWSAACASVQEFAQEPVGGICECRGDDLVVALLIGGWSTDLVPYSAKARDARRENALSRMRPAER